MILHHHVFLPLLLFLLLLLDLFLFVVHKFLVQALDLKS